MWFVSSFCGYIKICNVTKKDNLHFIKEQAHLIEYRPPNLSISISEAPVVVLLAKAFCSLP